jgi:hypothetical protein
MVGAATELRATRKVVDHDSFTLVEAVRDGWWYAALLPTGRLALVYMSDPDLISVKITRTVEGWMGLVRETQSIQERILSGGYRLSELPRVLCAGSSLLHKVVGESWLAAGDAAATYDPLSSQGITSALTSGLQAGRAILAARQEKLKEYGLRMQERYSEYLAYRAAYYSMEDRWTRSAFWQRRSLVSQGAVQGP